MIHVKKASSKRHGGLLLLGKLGEFCRGLEKVEVFDGNNISI